MYFGFKRAECFVLSCRKETESGVAAESHLQGWCDTCCLSYLRTYMDFLVARYVGSGLVALSLCYLPRILYSGSRSSHCELGAGSL